MYSGVQRRVEMRNTLEAITVMFEEWQGIDITLSEGNSHTANSGRTILQIVCLVHEQGDPKCLVRPLTGSIPPDGALELPGQTRTETQVTRDSVGRLKSQQRSSVCLNQRCTATCKETSSSDRRRELPTKQSEFTTS